MLDDTTDKSLVRGIAEGDRDALAALYDRYAGDMLAVGMKYLPDTSVAEEVIHDVFLEVWRNARAYDPQRATVFTWLMVKMRSRTLDKLRYEERRDHDRLEDAASRRKLTSGDDPSEEHDHGWIRQTVEDLPERLRDVLVCTYFFEMTGPEIADELDIPVGTVRSRLASAREELRKRAGPDEVSQNG